MPDTRELQLVAEAAEQAAALGDYATAERLLRELAQLQESRLGPLHADLANTLNNLGVVCDFADKPDEAERCYRRALTIARAAFAPDHSFVVTSEKNLREFCAARGRPFESPAETPRAPEERPEIVDLPDTLLRFEAEPPESPTASTGSSTRSPVLLLAGGVAAVVVVGVLVAVHPWSGSSNREPSPQNPVQSPAAAPTTSVPPVVEPSAKAPASHPPTPSQRTQSPTPPRGLPAPTVAAARLCKNLATGEWRRLDDWPCESPGAPAEPGSVFFYTRVRSARDTTVQHRWYCGNDLIKVVELQIRSSPTDGYRTYSRNVVDGRNGGRWRVELRSKDGALLHEEQLTVR